MYSNRHVQANRLFQKLFQDVFTTEALFHVNVVVEKVLKTNEKKNRISLPSCFCCLKEIYTYFRPFTLFLRGCMNHRTFQQKMAVHIHSFRFFYTDSCVYVKQFIM